LFGASNHIATCIMKKTTLLLLFSFLFAFLSTAQDRPSGLWSQLDERQFDTSSLVVQPQQYEIYRLELEQLNKQLAQCKKREEINSKADYIKIDFPVFGMGLLSFNVFETPIMETELQAKYPDIRTYTGQCIDDPRYTIKLDVGPAGFHAMIFSNSSTIFISPATTDGLSQYLVFQKKDLNKKREDAFSCLVSDTPIHEHATNRSFTPNLPTGPELRTYRLALGTTAEYSTYHGGTKELALAAMVTAMNRVNGIYERDFTITMLLVNNTDTLIYLDPDTDPYTNNDLGAMLGENQQLCDSLIGFDNYDVGHVFGTAGGGLAGLGVVCGGAKAWGATGLGAPEGDFFSVDYVSHEFGHQFGAGHTFNDCGSQSGQPYEPGSGVTIMAYAGLCGASNLQNTSIDQFHVASYDQVIQYTQFANGNTCPEITATGNTPPTIELETGGFYIPYATPFELTGSATDLEGDSLTYCWEQFDLGPSVHPDSAVGTAPLFRSWKPVNTPTRIFPRIEDLVANTPTIGELLPQFGRELNFRLTVRDNRSGGGGVDYEQITFYTTDSSGHFRLITPDNSQVWTAGTLEMISWDVANSNQPPVNCQKVDIWLSEDGGYTYPHLIAENRENNGVAVVTVPNITGNQIRLKVKAADNIFFDVSNANNVILPASNPDFTIEVNTPVATICGNEPATFSIELDSLLGFQEAVNLDIIGQPTGTAFSFSDNNIIPPASVILTVSNPEATTPGNYTINLQASSSSGVKNLPLSLKIRDDQVPAVSLVAPFDGSNNVDRAAVFSWNIIPWVTTYTFELSETPDFSSPLYSAEVYQHYFTPPTALNPNTIYFWRVKVSGSDCGDGLWSPVFSFQTELLQCANYNSDDLPVAISSSGTPTEYSSLEISQDILLTDVNVINLAGVHTWVSDLHISILGPSGDSVLLFSNICGDQDDFFLYFDDSAPTNEIPCPPTTGMYYQPQEPLSTFNGTNANGTWQIKIFDDYNQDGGELQFWGLELCGPPINFTPPTISLVPDSVEVGGMLTISNSKLSGDCNGDSLEYVITSLPMYGALFLDGNTVAVGTIFTQADIDNNLLMYVHNDLDAEPDQFGFIMSCENGNYIGALVYEITIFSLSGTAAVEAHQFKLFPNPANQYFSLQLDQFTGPAYELRIVDMLGRTVSSYDIRNAYSQLNASHLLPGLYVVQLYLDGQLLGKEKMIIAR
jgi:subtilisin-like proprotein convertase family protein